VPLKREEEKKDRNKEEGKGGFHRKIINSTTFLYRFVHSKQKGGDGKRGKNSEEREKERREAGPLKGPPPPSLCLLFRHLTAEVSKEEKKKRGRGERRGEGGKGKKVRRRPVTFPPCLSFPRFPPREGGGEKKGATEKRKKRSGPSPPFFI